MRVIQFDEFAQERFCRFLLDGICRGCRRFIGPVPIGNKPFAVPCSFTELLLPASGANVQAPKGRFIIEEQRVVILFVVKAATTRRAGVCT